MWAVRACGARERERSGQRRETAERRGARAQGRERAQREGTGQRDSIADGTALRNTVGEKVAATFGDTEDLYPEGSLFVSLRAKATYSPFFCLSINLSVKKMSKRSDDHKT